MGKLHKFKDTIELWETITELEKENTDLKLQVKFLHQGLLPVGELNDTLELEEYRKLKSEVKLGIERLKSKDDQYWCLHPDENGNKIPMTKVKGSRVMSKEEVEELNKIKLPF